MVSWRGSNTIISTTNIILLIGHSKIPFFFICFFNNQQSTNNQFSNKLFEPIYCYHIWLHLFLSLAILFLKQPRFSVSEHHQLPNSFFSYSIYYIFVMIASVFIFQVRPKHWLCAALPSNVFYSISPIQFYEFP